MNNPSFEQVRMLVKQYHEENGDTNVRLIKKLTAQDIWYDENGNPFKVEREAYLVRFECAKRFRFSGIDTLKYDSHGEPYITEFCSDFSRNENEMIADWMAES